MEGVGGSYVFTGPSIFQSDYFNRQSKVLHCIALSFPIDVQTLKTKRCALLISESSVPISFVYILWLNICYLIPFLSTLVKHQQIPVQMNLLTLIWASSTTHTNIKSIQLRDCPILECKESPMVLNPHAVIAGLTSLLGSFVHNMHTF